MDNVVLFPSSKSAEVRFPIAEIRDGEIVAEIEAIGHTSNSGVTFYVSIVPILSEIVVDRDRIDVLIARCHLHLQKMFPHKFIPPLEKAAD